MDSSLENIPFETLKSLTEIYSIQRVIENIDNALMEYPSRIQILYSFRKIEQVYTIYNEILPPLIGMYEVSGKKHLGYYGYKPLTERFSS